MKKATAILIADLHFRDTQPMSRVDDFIKTQFEIKLPFLLDLATENQCPILVAGDFFHVAKSSPQLELLILKALIKSEAELLVIPGQHDLPNHSVDQFDRSSLAVIETAYPNLIAPWINKIKFYQYGKTIVESFPFGMKIGVNVTLPKHNTRVALSHQMVANTKYKTGKKTWESIGATQAKALLKKHKEFDLIVTGDNHQSFSEEHEGRLLVNPGSLTRQTADQIDHKPRVALWYAEDNSIEWVYLPIEKDVFNTVHLEKAKERDDRIEAFVTQLNDNHEVGLSFENNMKEYLAANRTRSRVKQIIEETMENE